MFKIVKENDKNKFNTINKKIASLKHNFFVCQHLI